MIFAKCEWGARLALNNQSSALYSDYDWTGQAYMGQGPFGIASYLFAFTSRYYMEPITNSFSISKAYSNPGNKTITFNFTSYIYNRAVKNQTNITVLGGKLRV